MGMMSEYIGKMMSGKELEDELLRLVREYNRIRNTYLMVYAAALDKPIPDVSLGMFDYYTISDMLKKAPSKKLDFYLETPGGSGEAAEEIVRFLRSKFDDVAFVVSGEAKSAGTILVLSADEIFMSESGSLGPIDAQIRIGRSVVSASDYLEWVKDKSAEANTVGKLNPFDATMVAQISPGELKLVHNMLEYAKDLVIDWLPEHKFKNWNLTETRKMPVTPTMKTDAAKKIATDLANHSKWRTHGRSIKIDDLEGIGLKIRRLDNDANLADVVYRIQTVVRLLFMSTTIYKVFATADEKIFRQAVPMGFPPHVPLQAADVVEMEVSCPKCGKKRVLYAKFVANPQIDKDFGTAGKMPFPKDNRLQCDCGFQIDLTGLRNDIETKIGKKILT